MIRRLATLFFVCTYASVAQTEPMLHDVLSFEAAANGNCPGGWYCNPSETITVDTHIVHSGKSSVCLQRRDDSSGPFSTIIKTIPIDFAGSTLELRGYLRTEDVRGFAALWMREDGDSGAVQFSSMEGKNPVTGTKDWTEYSISAPLNPSATTLVFGFLLSGSGKAWADDLTLLLDGKPVESVPKIEKRKTPLDSDHEFDQGSRIQPAPLSPLQIGNLATLCRIWGFLKYHHAEVTAGRRHFDYDLFRILPAVLAARDRNGANDAITRWIANLGQVSPCNPNCSKLDEKNLYYGPDLAWIADKKTLGPALSQTLEAILKSRPATTKQFYVRPNEGAGNALFEHELSYAQLHFPDMGFELLGLFRFWNIVEYWYPYRDIMGEDWNKVLLEFIPRIAATKDRHDYELELMQLIAKVHDAHANLWSAWQDYPPGGTCGVPVQVRFIEHQAVVSGFADQNAAENSGLQPGDLIQAVNGVPVSELVKERTPFYGASNEASMLRNIATSLLRGDCGKAASLQLQRDGKPLTVNASRQTIDPHKLAWLMHDRPGDTFQMLSKDVAYLKLSSIKASGAERYIDSAASAKGLIIDIRNYPAEFTVFALGQKLVEKPTAFATFTIPDTQNPGAFHWGESETLKPESPHFKGKLVILVDEASQSQSEYTAMAFRSAPRAIVMGSMTAGADGNVSQIPLPGGFNTMISGIGVFYPGKKPTQRIGIVPDIKVSPTVAGIRTGRDEVLEAAMKYIQQTEALPAQ